MSFAFVDSHVHFWDQTVNPYPWLAEVPAIAGRHRPEELHAEAGARFPAQIVFVECGAPPVAEVDWIEQLAASEPRLAAIVAKCMVHEGAATDAALAALARRPLVRGVRHLIQDEPDPEFCLRPAFVAGVRRLGELGLSFDVCCRHHQLGAVVQLVRACPGTRFVLDHFGKPDIRGRRLDPWRAHLSDLAMLPNVDCKLSGLITEADHAHWTPADLQPYVAEALVTFGASRLLFGGDWPVAKLAGTYVRWLEVARALTAHLPAADQAAIFAGTARRVYRLAS